MKKQQSINGRSNSSQAIRDQIKKEQVIVPDVNSKVDFNRYYSIAQSLYEQAHNLYKRNNTRGAYVDFHRFMLFVAEKLPKHDQYSSTLSKDPEVKRWLDRSIASSFSLLEAIVVQMDQQEDENIETNQLMSLIEEFDVHTDINAGSGDTIKLEQITPSLSLPHIAGTSLFTSSSSKGTPISAGGSASPAEILGKPQKLDKFAILRLPEPTSTISGGAAGMYRIPDERGAQVHGPSGADLRSFGDAIAVVPSGGVVRPETGTSSVIQGAVVSAHNPDVSSLSSGSSAAVLAVDEVTEAEIRILQHLRDYRRFPIPVPHTRVVEFVLGGGKFTFRQDDFHVSFASFLQTIPSELQADHSAVETNRCFFLHLGMAFCIHPYVLQSAFRYHARRIAKEGKEDWIAEIVSSIQQYAGFVDANALCFLWPKEFNRARICLISGPQDCPIFSCFVPPAPVTASSSLAVAGVGVLTQTQSGLLSPDADPYAGYKEVLIRCDNGHFTLLHPMDPRTGSVGGEVLTTLLTYAKLAGYIVQINEVEDEEPSEGESSSSAGPADDDESNSMGKKVRTFFQGLGRSEAKSGQGVGAVGLDMKQNQRGLATLKDKGGDEGGRSVEAAMRALLRSRQQAPVLAVTKS